jgi:hypothetical protein
LDDPETLPPVMWELEDTFIDVDNLLSEGEEANLRY